MDSPTALASVIDISSRRQAREKIVQTANRIRLHRYQYVAWHVAQPVELPKRLSLRNLHEAVAIVRHWKAADDETLAAAGFRPARTARPAPAADIEMGEAA